MKIMFHLGRNKKTVFLAVMLTTLCLVFSSFTPMLHSQVTGFTLPCVITTTGNAWNGYIAFDLQVATATSTSYYFVVMDTNGTVLAVRESATSYGGAAYNIAPDTIMFEGEPQVDGYSGAPTFATHFWNLSTGTTEDFPNVVSEHDIQFDPVNNTFLTLQQYIQTVGNKLYLVDEIIELDPNGSVMWTWNSYDHIPLSEVSPFAESYSTIDGTPLLDFIHANSLDWDYNDSVIYLNSRATDTFYKINETTGNIIWACGRFGNFTLLGPNGQPLPANTSLWYGEHDVREVAPDVFTIFNNDYDNITNPDDCHSSLMEVTLNEKTMKATVNFDWEAPTAYWNEFAGDNVLLPNGDFIGDFGDPSHQFPQNELPNGTWNFNDTGAVFVEVNSTGQVVRTFTFPVGCYVYRVETVTDPASISFAPTSVVTPTPAPASSTSTSVSPTQIVVITPTPARASPAPALASPTPIPTVTPTPPVSPSSFSPVSISFLVIIAGVVLVVVVAVVVLVALLYTRKRIATAKLRP